MKKLVASVGGIAVLALVAMVLSCAAPPTAQIEEARKAIEDAKAAEADLYSAADFTAAQDSLAAAERYLEEKNYKAAKAAAVSAKETAEAAVEAATQVKEGAKAEVEGVAEEIRKAVADQETAAAKLRGAARKEADAKVAALKATLAEFEEALKAGNYATAKAKADQIKASIGR